MLSRRATRGLQTAVFLLLPLLLVAIWLPLLPERAALTLAAARSQLVPESMVMLRGMTFSPLWSGLLGLLAVLPAPLLPLAAGFSALGWGTAALLLARCLRRLDYEWAALLLPWLLLLSPLLPATLATAVSWQLAIILLVTNATLDRQWRQQTISLLLLPLLWADWPALLLAGWSLWQRRRHTGHLPMRGVGGTAVLFIGGGILNVVIWGRAATAPMVDLAAGRFTLSQLLAESDFYGLALLIVVLAMGFVLRRGFSAPAGGLTGGWLLLGAAVLLSDAQLSIAIWLLAALPALAATSAWLAAQMRPRLAVVSLAVAGLALTVLLGLPLFLAQTSSLWQRYQARPLAHADLLAQAGAWLAAETEMETAVVAPAALATHLERPLWPFPAPESSQEWGAFMAALIEAPPAHVVSSSTLAWDRLVRTGWFQERYRPVQQFTAQAAVPSPVTVWAYDDSPFDRGEHRPIQVRADNGLRLVGYRYWPRTIQPGAAVYVTLDWQATAPLSSNVNTIVRVISQADQAGWAQRNLRTPRSLPPAWITPEAVTFPERFVLTTTNEIGVGAYQLNVSLITGRDEAFTPLYQNEDDNVLDRVLLGYVTVPWQETIPATAVSVNGTFGDQVVLDSYTLEGEIRPGETMTATLYWEALRPPDADYTVFVHLLDEAGQFVAGFDSPPLYGRYPTRGWLPGSPVPDPHPLTLPPDLPPGDYWLRAGLYLPDSGERLTAVDAAGATASNNALLLQTITVAP